MPFKKKEKKRQYQKNYWSNVLRKDKKKYKKKRKQDLERAQKRKLWVRHYLLLHGCAKCPEKDPRCLEFHHVKKKDKTIRTLLMNHVSLEKIKKEMKKCIILCRNCHQKEHIDDYEIIIYP